MLVHYIFNSRDYTIDLSPNNNGELYCSGCGEMRAKNERVDTIGLFDEDEAYCFSCWMTKLRGHVVASGVLK